MCTDLLAWDMLICLGLAVVTCCYFWQAVQGWFALLAIAPNKNLLSVDLALLHGGVTATMHQPAAYDMTKVSLCGSST